MDMTGLRVAMIAPPWLEMPPHGYGGLEYVVHFLTIELERRGVEVELFATADSRTPCTRLHSLYDHGQYDHIAKPLYEVAALPIAHQLFALEQIKRDGDFDIIHDHNSFLGPAMSAFAAADSIPPTLHTLHGPFTSDTQVEQGAPDSRDAYKRMARCDRLYFNAISKAQLVDAPQQLLPKVVDVVYNAVNINDYAFVADKSDYFITLARFSRDKGQATAARLARKIGVPLHMAGIVNGIATPDELISQLEQPTANMADNPDLAYFRDEVLPLIEPGRVEFLGNVAGEEKSELLSNAKGLLFPIDWEEPFGMAVIEAMACGTPVIAMRRGAMPELIEHGVNGFLADNEDEFEEYMRRIDEIDPADCRRTVARRFSAPVMADAYIDCYRSITQRHEPPARIHEAPDFARPLSSAFSTTPAISELVPAGSVASRS